MLHIATLVTIAMPHAETTSALNFFTRHNGARALFSGRYRIGEMIPNRTALECTQLCLAHGKACRGVEFRRNTGGCQLKTISTIEIGSVVRPAYDYYDRLLPWCGTSESMELLGNFRLVAGSQQLGIKLTNMDKPSCLAACATYGPECVTVEFQPTHGWCILRNVAALIESNTVIRPNWELYSEGLCEEKVTATTDAPQLLEVGSEEVGCPAIEQFMRYPGVRAAEPHLYKINDMVKDISIANCAELCVSHGTECLGFEYSITGDGLHKCQLRATSTNGGGN